MWSVIDGWDQSPTMRSPSSEALPDAADLRVRLLVRSDLSADMASRIPPVTALWLLENGNDVS